MNREQLQKLASEWTRMAKNDIRNKVISFMREVDASERELAYVLAISDGELKQILEGNGEITLSTFAKLLIATGNALEIKPIEDTPIGDYGNIPSEEESLSVRFHVQTCLHDRSHSQYSLSLADQVSLVLCLLCMKRMKTISFHQCQRNCTEQWKRDMADLYIVLSSLMMNTDASHLNILRCVRKKLLDMRFLLLSPSQLTNL